jgi:hypothetical protein
MHRAPEAAARRYERAATTTALSGVSAPSLDRIPAHPRPTGSTRPGVTNAAARASKGLARWLLRTPSRRHCSHDLRTIAWRKERSGYRNLILTISLRKNETPKRRNAETQKRRITTILATLMPSAGVRRPRMSRFGGKATLTRGVLPDARKDLRREHACSRRGVVARELYAAGSPTR